DIGIQVHLPVGAAAEQMHSPALQFPQRVAGSTVQRWQVVPYRHLLWDERELAGQLRNDKCGTTVGGRRLGLAQRSPDVLPRDGSLVQVWDRGVEGPEMFHQFRVSHEVLGRVPYISELNAR